MDDPYTSDHLPLLVDMMYAPYQEDHMEGAVSQRIDWDQARQSGEVVDYMNTVKSHLVPLLNTIHQELKYIARVLSTMLPRKPFPLFNPESHGGRRMIL